MLLSKSERRESTFTVSIDNHPHVSAVRGPTEVCEVILIKLKYFTLFFVCTLGAHKVIVDGLRRTLFILFIYLFYHFYVHSYTFLNRY